MIIMNLNVKKKNHSLKSRTGRGQWQAHRPIDARPRGVRGCGLRGTSTTCRSRQGPGRLRLGQPGVFGLLPNQPWVADIELHPTREKVFVPERGHGRLERRVPGWAMATHLRTPLALDALDMALYRRRPGSEINHSDRGSRQPVSQHGT